MGPLDLLTIGILLAQLLVLFVVVLVGLALLQRRLGEERVRRLLSADGSLVGLVKGAVLGAVTPFCSCSTVPLVLGLVRAGVRFGTVAAFLIASPLLNPIILGSVGVLFGWRLALGYGIVGFTVTLGIAAVWERARLERFLKPVKVVRTGAAPTPGEHETDDGTGTVAIRTADTWRGLRAELPVVWSQARRELRAMLAPLAIGVAIGGAIYGAVPSAFLEAVLGPGNPLAIPLAAIVGIPLYVRAEIALPVGYALLSSGVGLGPVFALIIGGAGASIPEVSLLTSIFRPPLVASFVASVLAVAIAGGLLIPNIA